jgi:hypothetical protein
MPCSDRSSRPAFPHLFCVLSEYLQDHGYLLSVSRTPTTELKRGWIDMTHWNGRLSPSNEIDEMDLDCEMDEKVI